jgi:hypothetical protein
VWDHTQIYYVCNAGDYVERPKLTASWYAEVMKNQHIAAVTVADEDADGSIAVPNRDRTKLRKTNGPDILQLTIDELRKQSYFDSTEDEMLFNPTEDETVLDAIDRRIELWKGVHERVHGWQNMVTGDSDYDEYTTARSG